MKDTIPVKIRLIYSSISSSSLSFSVLMVSSYIASLPSHLFLFSGGLIGMPFVTSTSLLKKEAK